MISRRTKKYCSQDISLIENYEKALADKKRTWHCHHRAETDEHLSKEELIKRGKYYNRPACELILLTEDDHAKLHSKVNGNPMFGRKMSDESKIKLSKNHLNKNGKKVVQLSKNNCLLKKYVTASEASRQTNIRVNHIIECCLGKRKSAGGYRWMYYSDWLKVCKHKPEDIKPLF